ncbi:hypothetical protein N9M73_01340 [Rhodobacteraceae bacterium]|nr:hypothetical protein [Paracoccaceae bacterium]
MARHNPNRKFGDEEESAFVSMTDLMISILFIVMILMAFFARSISQTEQETVPKPEYDRVVAIIENQKKEILNLKNTITEKDEEISRLKEIIKDLKKQIETKDDKIEEQKKSLLKKDEEISRLKEIIKNLKKQIETKDDKIEEQKKSLLKKDKEISRLKEIIKNLKKQIETKDDKIEEQKKYLLEKEQTIGLQQRKINSQESEIRRLKRENRILKKRLERLSKIKDTELAQVLDQISKARTSILKSIKLRLEDEGINVQVDTVSGIIRFDDSVIKFAPGSFRPSPEVTKIIKSVAEILEAELGCYSLGPNSRINIECNPSLSVLEAIQIEGHTDNIPLGQIRSAGLEDNLDLSAKRAAAAFRIMLNHRPKLEQFENANFINSSPRGNAILQGQPVLSISGYGEKRPIVPNNSFDGRSSNRRIDLRVIMTTPKSVQEANELSETINRFLIAREQKP